MTLNVCKDGLRWLVVLSFFVSVAAVAAKNVELVSAENFGNKWPFTVEEMHLLCLDRMVVIASDPETGLRYPLNGRASAQATMRSLSLQPLEKVWRDNPEIEGLKVSVGPMIERGLALCSS